MNKYQDPISKTLAHPWVWFFTNALYPLLAIFWALYFLSGASYKPNKLLVCVYLCSALVVFLFILANAFAGFFIARRLHRQKIRVPLAIMFVSTAINITCSTLVYILIHKGCHMGGVGAGLLFWSLVPAITPMCLSFMWHMGGFYLFPRRVWLDVFLTIILIILMIFIVRMNATQKFPQEFILQALLGILGFRLLIWVKFYFDKLCVWSRLAVWVRDVGVVLLPLLCAWAMNAPKWFEPKHHITVIFLSMLVFNGCVFLCPTKGHPVYLRVIWFLRWLGLPFSFALFYHAMQYFLIATFSMLQLHWHGFIVFVPILLLWRHVVLLTETQRNMDASRTLKNKENWRKLGLYPNI